VSGLTDDTNPGSMKANCKLFALGMCKKGDTCVFAHHQSAQQSVDAHQQAVDTLLANLADEGDEDEEEELKRELEAQNISND